jgi:hypothetical protein
VSGRALIGAALRAMLLWTAGFLFLLGIFVIPILLYVLWLDEWEPSFVTDSLLGLSILLWVLLAQLVPGRWWR